MTTHYAADINNGKVYFKVNNDNMDAACEAIAKADDKAEPYVFADNELDKFSGPDIVKMHNSLLPEGADPVKRFATKGAGIKRLESVLENAPEFDGKAPAKKKATKKKATKKKAAKKKAAKKKKASNADRSEAVKNTWTDPDVKAARRKRYKVKCNGVEYRSVPKAFEELGIPKSRAIKFRGKLAQSASGKATYTDEEGNKYQFTIVNKKD